MPWLRSRPLAALSEAGSLVPSTDMKLLTTSYNSSSRGSDGSFLPPRIPAFTYMCPHRIHIHLKNFFNVKNLNKFLYLKEFLF